MSDHLEPFHERGFRFACAIVKLYVALRSDTQVPYHLARQVLRSGTSIGANLEEAKAAQSRPDVKARFTVALKEARETKYWLRLLSATDLVPPTILAPLQQEAKELVAILTTARKNLSMTKGREDPSN